MDNTRRFYGLQSTRPKNFGTKNAATHLHAPSKKPAFTASIVHANKRHPYQIKCTHVPRASTRLSCMMSLMSSPDPVWPIHLDLNWIASKKKKKKKPLTMVDFDQKVKIFKTNLSHLVFRVHYNFGIRFFIQNSEIAQTSNFQKSWFFHKFWQKVKIFKKDLSCPIFCVDSNFGVYFFIWESKISQIVWFYIYWLWCELWACPIQIFAKILILKSTYLFWTWKPPIWPTSLKYWQCPKLRLPKSKFEIHPFSLDSLKVILQTASRLSF